MNCEICDESFDKTNSFNQHMTYVHGADNLQAYADCRRIATEFHKDVKRFNESDYCQICGVRSEYTVCVLIENSCKYAGLLELFGWCC
jgi:hypothetical protein